MITWYKDVGSKDDMKALTQDRNDADKRSNENIRLLSEINMSLCGGEIPHNGFFVINGFVSYIKADDKTTYNGCPDCHRKVFTDFNQMTRCENCNKVIEGEGEAIYMLTAKITDASESFFVNFYRTNAEPIMGGMTADEFNRLKPVDPKETDRLRDIVNQNLYKNQSILLKVRAEQHNENEYRYKYVGTKVLDF